MSKRFASVIAPLCLLAILLSFSIAQEKEAKKAKGRLPAYYKDVVTEKQRDQIYSIQEKYGEQIRKLAEEMKAATEKRDAEIEGVLTPEQKEKVVAAKAAAKTKPATKPGDEKTETTEAKSPAKEPAKTTAKPPAK